MVMLMPFRLVLMPEPVQVPLGHGRGLEVQGQVADTEVVLQ